MQDWILGNIFPLSLLAIALLLLLLGGAKGDNAAVMRRVGGVIIALGIVGLALTGTGVSIGTWLAHLIIE